MWLHRCQVEFSHPVQVLQQRSASIFQFISIENGEETRMMTLMRNKLKKITRRSDRRPPRP